METSRDIALALALTGGGGGIPLEMVAAFVAADREVQSNHPQPAIQPENQKETQ
jgi:hypothetical protein